MPVWEKKRHSWGASLVVKNVFNKWMNGHCTTWWQTRTVQQGRNEYLSEPKQLCVQKDEFRIAHWTHTIVGERILWRQEEKAGVCRRRRNTNQITKNARKCLSMVAFHCFAGVMALNEPKSLHTNSIQAHHLRNYVRCWGMSFEKLRKESFHNETVHH